MSLEATRLAWKLKLKSSQKLVILSLADRADSNNFCFPSIVRLTKDTCLNRKTVLEAIRILEELGHIKIEKGLGKVNKYILSLENPVPKTTPVPKSELVPKTVLPPVPDLVLPSTKNGTPTSPKNGTLTYQYNLSNNQSVELTNDEAFDLFWKNYPRKDDKKKAKVAFKKLSLKKKNSAINDCEARYIETEKQYIPMPTTYINNERWDNEIIKTGKPADKHGGFEHKDYQSGAITPEWAK
ncbi:MAG: helix-turn-helix domain-containing protein [Gammaproteobacteria bacterium]|nr:helix-turn-helix domain-containing protein [Gammaproteobacteria bacterium]